MKSRDIARNLKTLTKSTILKQMLERLSLFAQNYLNLTQYKSLRLLLTKWTTVCPNIFCHHKLVIHLDKPNRN